MQRKQIFISNIYSQLGLQLLQTFRNDHQEFKDYNFIIGTSNTNLQLNAKHTCIDFSKSPNLVIKAALQSDLILLNLWKPSVETQVILKYLRYGTFQKIKHIIGISPFMTWSNSKKIQNKQMVQKYANADPIELLKVQFQYNAFEDKSYQKRLPDHNYLYSYKLQNLLIDLNKVANLYGCIINTGLIYGKGFEGFQNIYQQGLILRENIIQYGQGKNLIPMVHVQDLCKMILKISQIKLLDKNNYKLYYIGVDNSEISQQKLINVFSQQLNLNKIIKKQLTYCSQQQAIFSTDIKIKRSLEFQNLNYEYIQGIIQHRHIIIGQYLENRQYQGFKIYLKGQISNDKTNCQKQLLNKYTFLVRLTQQSIQKYIKTSDYQIQLEFIKLIKNQKQIYQKRVAQIQADKKKKHNQIQPFKYSNKVIIQCAKYMISKSKLKAYILNCNNPQLNQLIISQIQKPNIIITFNSQTQDSIRYNSNQYKNKFGFQIIRQKVYKKSQTIKSQNQEQQQKDQNVSANSPNQLNNDDIDEINQQKQINTSNLKQYVIDRVMPSITQIIIQIQQNKPKNIIQYFIQSLRKKGQQPVNQQYIIE